MKLALAYFVGACTASAYWAASMWPAGNERGDGLWVLAVVMTLFSLIAAGAIASLEKN